MSIWKYHRWLPQVEENRRFTRGEGNTPLVRSVNIAGRLGVRDLYFKLENLNPSGSYKDRFAAVVISCLMQGGHKTCITTSSGNTGAALAAYCAAAQIKCIVIAVDGAPADKLLQMQAYGAEIYEVESFGKNAQTTSAVFHSLAKNAAGNNALLPVSAYCYCAEGMRGVETMAYEILECVPAQHIFSPAGGGGLTLAVARGSSIFSRQGGSVHPSIHCVQPAGNDTIATCLNNGEVKAHGIAASATSISGLQVPGVLDGDDVIDACRSSGGKGYVVDDDDVYHWQSELAIREGIFCEPAGAVALAGLVKAINENAIDRNEKIVCIVTGSGFKNMAAVKQHFSIHEAQKINIDQFQHLLARPANVR